LLVVQETTREKATRLNPVAENGTCTDPFRKGLTAFSAMSESFPGVISCMRVLYYRRACRIKVKAPGVLARLVVVENLTRKGRLGVGLFPRISAVAVLIAGRY
jgi:hypothetical protein